MKWLCKIIFERKGWKLNPNYPEGLDRCVMVAAPHTSNWDFVFALGVFHILKIPIRFAMKKEMLFFPFNIIFGALGALSIDRSPKDKASPRKSTVEAMAELFEKHQRLCLLIAPEGTRSLRKKWKTGFYYTALKAGVPIALGYVDYQKKEAGIGKKITPTGDLEGDMKEIMAFYKDIKAKYPENFSLDQDYA